MRMNNSKKFCVAGSGQIIRNKNANSRAEKWNDFIKQGGKLVLFLPLYKDEEGNLKIAIAGAYCHSVSKAVRETYKNLPSLILSTVERDPDTGAVSQDTELDVFSKLAIISRIAFNGEKAREWANIQSRNYQTQIEKDAAIKVWTENYQGVQEEGNTYKTRGKQPALSFARLTNYALGIACKCLDSGKIDPSTAKLVQLMPSSNRVGLFENALNKLITQYNANKREDPNVPEPTVLELVFDIGVDKDTDTKKQKVEPSGTDYLDCVEINSSKAKEYNALKAYFGLLPKDPYQCFERCRSFDERDEATILVNFKLVLMEGLESIDLITEEDDMKHLERNVDVLREVWGNESNLETRLKALNISEENKSEAEAIKEEINREVAQAQELAKTVGDEGIVGEMINVAPTTPTTHTTPVAPVGTAPASTAAQGTVSSLMDEIGKSI